MRLLFLGTLLFASLFASTATSQGCTIPGDRFLKNDSLPDIPPPVPTGVSVIPGLCEGEGAFTIFDAVSGNINLNSVSGLFASFGGFGGAMCAVDINFYDGVTENVGTIGSYQLGPRLWSLGTDGGVSAQLTASAINTFDLRPFGDGVVGPAVNVTSGKLVVEYVMVVNPNGNCLSGYTSNMATDFSGVGLSCPTPGVNGISTLNNGDIDPATFLFSGAFLLCDPLANFFGGNWVIRACITEEDPPALTSWSGVAQAGGAVIITMNAPASANNNYFVLLGGSVAGGGTPTPWGDWPLDFDVWLDVFLGSGRGLMSLGNPNGPTGPLPGVGALDANGFATTILTIPPNASVTGLTLYASFFAWDPNDLFAWSDVGLASDPIIFQ